MTRVDYRWLRLISVPFFLGAVALLVLVFVPSSQPRRGRLGALAAIGPLPSFHPAEIAKLALVIYLAHWLAQRGSERPLVLARAPCRSCDRGLRRPAGRLEPDLGTTGVITLTAFTMFFVAGASLWQLAVMAAGGATAVIGLHAPRLPARSGSWIWQDPWHDRLGAGYHTIQGLLALGSAGCSGRVSARADRRRDCRCPTPSTTSCSPMVGQEFGLLGGRSS